MDMEKLAKRLMESPGFSANHRMSFLVIETANGECHLPDLTKTSTLIELEDLANRLWRYQKAHFGYDEVSKSWSMVNEEGVALLKGRFTCDMEARAEAIIQAPVFIQAPMRRP